MSRYAPIRPAAALLAALLASAAGAQAGEVGDPLELLLASRHGLHLLSPEGEQALAELRRDPTGAAARIEAAWSQRPLAELAGGEELRFERAIGLLAALEDPAADRLLATWWRELRRLEERGEDAGQRDRLILHRLRGRDVPGLVEELFARLGEPGIGDRYAALGYLASLESRRQEVAARLGAAIEDEKSPLASDPGVARLLATWSAAADPGEQP